MPSAKDKFLETLRTSAEGGLVDDELHGYSCRVTAAAACTQTQARIFSFVCVCVFVQLPSERRVKTRLERERKEWGGFLLG